MPSVNVLGSEDNRPVACNIVTKCLTDEEISQLTPTDVRVVKASFMSPAQTTVVHMSAKQRAAYEASQNRALGDQPTVSSRRPFM